ncbi:hypothetical protein [Dyadobacter chenhuakuii]|uniref:Uncharacterized protein n=1 Tax=Dyadobacter chenhuakuii TaxID=2909339 RepID=A0A9X1QC09_9BACT|nr:hypothetical protein [Dyadobacter chenhuakuii]MCF2498366.1 hypothetical protein [Dyadobacter chenhuakuii]
MKRIYYLCLAAFAVACGDRNDSQNYVSSDTTAVTVETPAIDTTMIDTSASDESAGMVVTPDESETVADVLARLSLQEQQEYLDKFSIPYQQSSSSATGYKYNSRTGSSGYYSYNYDIEGEDENGNSVSGNIDIQGKTGTGTITDEDGNEKSIDVQWVDYGVLQGSDEDGVTYEFHVDD